jgi:hypothetical protein
MIMQWVMRHGVRLTPRWLTAAVFSTAVAVAAFCVVVALAFKH